MRLYILPVQTEQVTSDVMCPCGTSSGSSSLQECGKEVTHYTERTSSIQQKHLQLSLSLISLESKVPRITKL